VMGLVLLLVTFAGTLNWSKRNTAATFEQ